MSVEVNLTSVKPLSNTSTTSIVEMSNFNFRALTAAISEFLTSINYDQNEEIVSIDVNNIDADLIGVRHGLKVYGAEQLDGTYPTTVELFPSGAVHASNFKALDVTSTLRLRLRAYGLIPSTGIPGEIIYIRPQGTWVEGVYVWLTSSGWTLLAGTNTGGYGTICLQGVVLSAPANEVTDDNTEISATLFLVPAPIASTSVLLFINGLQTIIGDGSKLMPAYFSKDGGITASNIRDLDSTDLLYFNPSVSGYTLEDYDTVTLQYFTIDPYCAQSGYSCITQVAESDPTHILQFDIEIIGPPSEPGPLIVCQIPTPTTSELYTLPDGFYLENSILSYTLYDVNSVYGPGTVIKFTLPNAMTEPEFDSVRIFHEVGGILTDVTILSHPSGLYLPDYPNRWLYAQVNSFSPFYLIPYVPATTTTSTTTTTTEAPLCPENDISFSIPYGQNPTQITFYGTPAGPLTVEFIDEDEMVHDLTDLLGETVSLPWVFDLVDEKFAQVPSVIGTYTFTYLGSCPYVIEVPISVIGEITTTTTTIAPTTTTTSSTTTTTTEGPMMMPMVQRMNLKQESVTTTTTEQPTEINFLIPYDQLPTRVTFYGYPSGPYSVEFTDELAETYDLTGLLKEEILLPWVFDLSNINFSEINRVIGSYVFKYGDQFEYYVEIPSSAVDNITTTTTIASTTTTSTTTIAPTTTTSTTSAPITTTTTARLTTTTTTLRCQPNEISFSIPYGKNPTQITFYGTPEGPHSVEFVDMLGNSHDLTQLLGNEITLPWIFDLNNVCFSEVATVIGEYFFNYNNVCLYEVDVPISVIGTITTTTTTSSPTTTTTTIPPTTTTTTTIAPVTTTTTIRPVTSTTSTTTVGISYLVDLDKPYIVSFTGAPEGPYEVVYTDPYSNMFNLSNISGDLKTLPWSFNRNLQSYVDSGITTISGLYQFKINEIVIHSVQIFV